MLMINIIIIAGTEREVYEDDTIILCLLMDFIADRRLLYLLRVEVVIGCLMGGGGRRRET